MPDPAALPSETVALLRCAHGCARLTREDMALLLSALQLADEGPRDAGYRLVLWKVRTALGLEASHA